MTSRETVARTVDDSGPKRAWLPAPIRVLVADDQRSLRQAICDLVANDPESLDLPSNYCPIAKEGNN